MAINIHVHAYDVLSIRWHNPGIIQERLCPPEGRFYGVCPSRGDATGGPNAVGFNPTDSSKHTWLIDSFVVSGDNQAAQRDGYATIISKALANGSLFYAYYAVCSIVPVQGVGVGEFPSPPPVKFPILCSLPDDDIWLAFIKFPNTNGETIRFMISGWLYPKLADILRDYKGLWIP